MGITQHLIPPFETQGVDDKRELVDRTYYPADSAVKKKNFGVRQVRDDVHLFSGPSRPVSRFRLKPD